MILNTLIFLLCAYAFIQSIIEYINYAHLLSQLEHPQNTYYDLAQRDKKILIIPSGIAALLFAFNAWCGYRLYKKD